jgi:hypothetical protein
VVKVHDFLISFSPIGAKAKKILGEAGSLSCVSDLRRLLEELPETR